jgi:hypothetical protein
MRDSAGSHHTSLELLLRSAQFWWAFILCTVLVTAWWEPWGLAFTEHPGL